MENKNDKKTVELTISTIKELWSKTYNTDGKPDWSHIFPYYHPEIIFQDSVQKLQGIDNFKAMCNRLAGRCRKLHMEIISVLQDSDIIMMDWKMTMSFRKFPDKPVFGCTRLTLHDDGRIIEQRDYFDLWGDIFDGIPVFKKIYRKFMARFFG